MPFMLIQCQSCNSRYRLNLDRIPNRKAFIKCRKCSGPIYIDPREGASQEALDKGDARVPAPGARGGGVDGFALVTCTDCDARYRVPAQQLLKRGLKLKCTSCGNMFPVPEGLAPAEEVDTPQEDFGVATPPPDFFPSAGDAGEQMAAPGSGEMPVPDDSRVSTMFDDLKVNLGGAQPGIDGDPMSFDAPYMPPPDAGAGDPERAYMDAISLTEDGSPPNIPNKGTLTDSKKYRFFMKPSVEGDDKMADGNKPEDDGLPPLDSDEQALAGEMETDVQGEPPFVPPLDEESAPPAMDDIPPVPVVREEPKPEHPNSPVPDQEITKAKENQRFIMLWAAIIVVLLIGAGFGAWLWTLPGSSQRFMVQDGTPAEFTIANTRKGYFITNKPSGERLYVVTGEVTNGFDKSEQVGWIKLKGTAIGRGNSRRESFSYIGNMLNENQLATWALPAIRAYYGYLNGRDDGNYQIPQGKKVSFQIVMSGVKPPIQQFTTELVSYQRAGLPVYVAGYQ